MASRLPGQMGEWVTLNPFWERLQEGQVTVRHSVWDVLG